MNYLTVPDTGAKLVDGSIVILSRFPGTRWIVHNGWYSYNGQQNLGWYFCSIPAQTVIPVTEADLRLVTVVTSDCGCPPYPLPYPPPFPPPTPPSPCPPDPESLPTPFTLKLKDYLNRAFITVETEGDRDNLTAYDLPDGKLVRVNNFNGEVKYFEWHNDNSNWTEVKFDGDIDLSQYLTKEEANLTYATNETVESTVTESVQQAIEAADIESKIEEALSSSESVKEAVKDAANEAIPSIVDGYMEDVMDRLETCETHLTWEKL